MTAGDESTDRYARRETTRISGVDMTADTPAACLVCHRPTGRWVVCPRCQDRTDDDLAEIGALYCLLDVHRWTFELLGPADTNARGKRIDPPAPGDLHIIDVLDARGGPWAVLASWVQLIREERLERPQTRRDTDPDPGANPDTFVALVAFLRAWWPRLCDDHPAADDFAREMRDTRRLLDEAVRGPRSRRVHLGRCPVVLPATDTTPARECGAVLHHDPTQPVIRCHACGTAWSDEEWPRLAAMLQVG